MTLSIGHGSGGDKALLKKCFENFDINKEFNFPNDIKDRDVSDVPNYYFRDDGLKLWHAIKDYAYDVINVFYETDKDVEQDNELQQWETEIYK